MYLISPIFFISTMLTTLCILNTELVQILLAITFELETLPPSGWSEGGGVVDVPIRSGMNGGEGGY